MIPEQFPQVWNYLSGKHLDNQNIYAEKGLIPLGTKKPYFMYPKGDKGKIIVPEDEIIYIKFDKIDVPMTKRKAFNILILGGSGDGKTLLGKLIWSVLHDAGWYNIFCDAKSTDGGRAKIAWNNPRIPPKMKAKQIKLKHYLPVFATRNFDHMVHNFNIYSLRLHNIQEKEQWMGLGCTNKGASKIAKLIQRYGRKVDMYQLNNLLKEMRDDGEINASALDSMQSILVDLEDYRVIDESLPELNLLQDFKDGFSVCISYNSCSMTFMSFDIGMKINQCVKYFFKEGNRNPVMFFLDDTSYWAKEKKELLAYNFGIQETKCIGYNYRSLGISNTMIVQSLGIIDETVAESYKIKIITPSFSNPESLEKINVPKGAIELIKNNKLYINKEKHVMEYILINEQNEYYRFFPFMCPCGHLTEVYSPREFKKEK